MVVRINRAPKSELAVSPRRLLARSEAALEFGSCVGKIESEDLQRKGEFAVQAFAGQS